MGDVNVAYIAEQSVTNALAALRQRIAIQRNETAPRSLATVQFHNHAIDCCLSEIDATIAALGLAPKEMMEDKR